MSFICLKKKKILGILVKNISVNVSNKSRGSEMHWVGGGIKSSKGQYLPFYVRIIGVNVVVFYFFCYCCDSDCGFFRIAKKRNLRMHISV